VSPPELGQALECALAAGGDSLVVLYRPSSHELKKHQRWAEELPAVLVEDEVRVCVGLALTCSHADVTSTACELRCIARDGTRNHAEQLTSHDTSALC